MTIRAAAAALLAAAMTAGVAWLSRVPSDFGNGDGAVVRLSWRVGGVPVEACRVRTEEELAPVPVHMRSPRECTSGGAPFALDVAIDGRTVVRDTVFPKGARGDGPVYVFRDLPAEAGRIALSVRFHAVLGEDAEPAEGVASLYAWEGEVELEPAGVALLTVDGSGNLALRTTS